MWRMLSMMQNSTEVIEAKNEAKSAKETATLAKTAAEEVKLQLDQLQHTVVTMETVTQMVNQAVDQKFQDLGKLPHVRPSDCEKLEGFH